MKFYLQKHEPVVVTSKVETCNGTMYEGERRATAKICKLIPYHKNRQTEHDICKIFNDQLEIMRSNNGTNFENFELSISMPTENAFHQRSDIRKGHLRISDPSGITEALSSVFGRANVMIQVVLRDLMGSFSPFFQTMPKSGQLLIRSNVMQVQSDEMYVCEGTVTFGSTSFYKYFFYGRGIYRGDITTIVTVEDIDQSANDENIIPRDMPEVDSDNHQNQIVTTDNENEITIVARNGAGVKCNKSYLEANSDVFCAMFRSDMVEARTQVVKMTNMSEDGVRAFLNYLQYRDGTAANSNSVVAYELLRAGEKYLIPGLEEAMKKLLISKPIPWFDVDVALKLTQFTSFLPTGDELKKKARQAFRLNYCAPKQCAIVKKRKLLVPLTCSQKNQTFLEKLLDPKTCIFCLQKFKTRQHLDVHIRRHINEKPFSCNTCDKSFVTKYQLVKHLRNGHSSRPPRLPSQVFPKGKKKCIFCGQEFSRNDHLENHIRSHIHEKPYPCDKCSMSFVSFSSRVQHVFKKHKKGNKKLQ